MLGWDWAGIILKSADFGVFSFSDTDTPDSSEDKAEQWARLCEHIW